MSSQFTPPPSYGLQRQSQVYLAGLAGQRPQIPVAVQTSGPRAHALRERDSDPNRRA